jgi:uncharacterized protein YcbK (DUF882 family)
MSNRRPADPARRRAMATLAAAAAASVLPGPARADAGRHLVLMHTHTGEVLDAVFGADAGARPGELGRLDWLLRDFRTGDVKPLDARLFDLLCELADAAGVEARYEVISAYRSPATNAMLVETTDGVSSKSLHMEGKAIDVRLVSVPLAGLRDVALARAAGGVGYYPDSDFVHLDVGRVRSWSG